MKSTMSTLIALCEKTDNDIRACLNSIQVRQTEVIWCVSMRQVQGWGVIRCGYETNQGWGVIRCGYETNTGLWGYQVWV